MRLYNTLGRQLREFIPLKSEEVTLYTCGPTVYNFAHIGNLRSFIFDDTLRRTLEVQKYKVKHVMNITDVGHLVSDADEGEDKLEKGAKREGKTVWEVARDYTDAFKRDIAALNILSPNGYTAKADGFARATDFIDEQIALVSRLLEKGFAYKTTQAIYFEVSKLNSYGELSGQLLQQKEVAARSEVVRDTDKRGPHDFAVWFFTVNHYKDHTMRWQSPWGEGFPGWHLECSAIIHGTLGGPIDIHTGGIDHIGTHHPNEMAQTEAAFGYRLATYWLHNEFILVDGSKMSKSLGNSYVLADITAKGYDPLSLRLLCLQAHYRSELNFSWNNLTAAENRLWSLRSFATLKWQPLGVDLWLTAAYSEEAIAAYAADDLDTPGMLAYLSPIVAKAEELLISPQELPLFNSLLQTLDTLLGLRLNETKDITDEQKILLQKRQNARNEKNWSMSDKLRDTLLGQGISVRDTARGQIWNPVKL